MPAQRRRDADQPVFNLPVSRQGKADLVRLANFFGIEPGNLSLNNLRKRINRYLDNNYAQYATDDRYKRLYGRRRNRQPQVEDEEEQPEDEDEEQQQPQDEEEQREGSQAQSDSPTSDHDDEDDESWNGIPDDHAPVRTRRPPPRVLAQDVHRRRELTQDWVTMNNGRGSTSGHDQNHSGTPIPPVPPPIAIPTALPTTSTSTHTGRPERIPGHMASSAGYTIPEHIRKVFKSGWKTHVPFNQLTDAYCLYRHSTALPINEETIVLDSATGQISSAAKPVSADEEERLTFDEWHQAYRRIIQLISEYAPRELDLWRTHFDRILNTEDRAEHWFLWLLYDIEIRRRACYTPIDPAQFHVAVWNIFELRYLKSSASSRVATSSNMPIEAPPPAYSNAPAPGPRDNRFRHNSFQLSNQQSSDYKIARCLFCGDTNGSHPSRNCSATTNIAGRPCFLTKRGNEPRRDAQGKQYCFAWNGIQGCSTANCPRGLHVCTLCGSKFHTAQRCNSL
ncbi:hypothetical protein BKA70DRAFT_1208672 [Coprinopsis sp. MPI-PUGE-AT-0042]|nr:hypothetical protein BKA70DRAFT_1208672 [Coprinopsis sp. MPI-PUGE-AT-0042]